MKRSVKALLGVLVFLALFATAAPVGAAELLRAAAGRVFGADTSFVDMPDMTGSFTVRVPNSCVVATVSLSLTTTNMCRFRVLLDDALMEGQGTDDLAGGSNPWLATTGFPIFTSYTVWQCNVSRGSHTIAVQWIPSSDGSSTDCEVRGRTLVVDAQ